MTLVNYWERPVNQGRKQAYIIDIIGLTLSVGALGLRLALVQQCANLSNMDDTYPKTIVSCVEYSRFKFRFNREITVGVSVRKATYYCLFGLIPYTYSRLLCACQKK
jgi:hypothetical protein